MSLERFSRRTVALAIVALFALLSSAGCTGGGNLLELSGRVFTASSVSLGANKGELRVTTSAGGNTATGTLTITDPSRAAAPSRLVIASANCNGTYDPSSGALNLSGSYENPTGTTHQFTVVGTLPTLGNNVHGSITITIDGVAYGPFQFGTNSSSTGGGNNNGGNNNGGNNQAGLIVSGSTVDASLLAPGVFTGTAGAEKITQSFTYQGVTYDGQYSIVLFKQGGGFSFDIFGLNVSNGQTFNATDARVALTFAGSNKVYRATSGTMTVGSVSSSSITVTFANAKFTGTTDPVTGATSTGEFTVNGSVTAPINVE